MGVKHRALDAKIDAFKDFIEKVAKGDKLVEVEYNQLIHDRDQLKQAFERVVSVVVDDPEIKTYTD